MIQPLLPRIAAKIEKVIEQFGQEERDRLAKEMPHREITLCQDETFHPQICLVAIEPVSNFLILEEYAAKRDAPTWNAAVDEALKPFSVTVIQCVSDQATALIAHAETVPAASTSKSSERSCANSESKRADTLRTNGEQVTISRV